MKFYLYDQNNSGGSFIVDEDVTHRLLIEADSVEEANQKAVELGVYFDGCDEGMDCPCCGDRWYSGDEKTFPLQFGIFSESEAIRIAEQLGGLVVETKFKGQTKERQKDVIFQTPESYLQYLADSYGWTDPDGYIYYKDGRKVSISGRKMGSGKR